MQRTPSGQFQAPTWWLITVTPDPGDPTLFSRLQRHQACMWYTHIHGSQALIQIKSNHKRNVTKAERAASWFVCAQAALELMTCLLPPPKHWDERHVPPHQMFWCLLWRRSLLFMSSSGWGGCRERMCDLKVVPSFIALSHPRILHQELVHR